MEFLLPNLDEFILDFDAEEALLHAQVLAAGQVAGAASASTGAVPGLGSLPVRQKQNLLNAAPRTRGRQQQHVGANAAPAAETVQLDSQLDALRREIARLEQQKHKQGGAKAAPTAAAANGNAGVRKLQKSANAVSAAKPAGGVTSGVVARAHAPVGQPTVRRVRAPPNQAAASTMQGTVASAPWHRGTVATPTDPGGNAASASAVTTSASSAQAVAAAGVIAAPAQPQVGAKRSADSAARQPAALQPRSPHKRQHVQRRPQLPAAAQAVEAPGPVAELGPGVLPPRRLPHEEAGPPPQHSDGDPGGGRGALGSEQQPTEQQQAEVQLEQQQGSGQAGPGPPRKRPRATGEPLAMSICGPGSAAGVSTTTHPNCRSAGGAVSERAERLTVVPNATTASNSSASTQDGSPAALAKRARPEVTGHGALQGRHAAGVSVESTRDFVDRGPAGIVANGPVLVGHSSSMPAVTGIADISPEAEQAATAFLMTFMTQISTEGQERGHDAVNLNPNAAEPPDAEDGAPDNSPVRLQQQQPQGPQHGACLGDRTPVAAIGTSDPPPGASQGAQGSAGSGHARGAAHGNSGRNVPISGGGGSSSARRAAAERTSAAVQRLRRKSSGMAVCEGSLRSASVLGAAAGTPIAAKAASTTAGKDSAVQTVPAGVIPCEAPLAVSLPALPVREGGSLCGPTSASAVQPLAWGTGESHARGPDGAEQAGDDTAVAVSAGDTSGDREHRGTGTEGLGTEGELGSGPSVPSTAGIRSPVWEADGRGAMSSPVPAPLAGVCLEDGARHPGQQLGGGGLCGAQGDPSAHQPPWVQLQGGGWRAHADQLRPEPGMPSEESVDPQLAQQAQQPHAVQLAEQRTLMSGATAPSHASGAAGAYGPASHAGTPAADAVPGLLPSGIAVAGATRLSASPPPPSVPHLPHMPRPSGPAAIPFRPTPPFGVLHSAGPPPFMFPQPPPGMPPHMVMPGGLFPAFFPGPPPGAQWRPANPAGVPSGVGQPMVSPVEVDVLARKELILLKWQMLREMAAELEAEWTDACKAHNRLRLLSMTHAQLPQVAAALSADQPCGNFQAAAPSMASRRGPTEDAAPSFHPHPSHSPPSPPLNGLQRPPQQGLEQPQLQRQEDQEQPQPEQQQSAGEAAVLQSGAVPMHPPLPNQHVSAPPALLGTGGFTVPAAAPPTAQTSLLLEFPGDDQVAPAPPVRSADRTAATGLQGSGDAEPTGQPDRTSPERLTQYAGGQDTQVCSPIEDQQRPQPVQQLRAAEGGGLQSMPLRSLVQGPGQGSGLGLERPSAEAMAPQLPSPAPVLMQHTGAELERQQHELPSRIHAEAPVSMQRTAHEDLADPVLAQPSCVASDARAQATSLPLVEKLAGGSATIADAAAVVSSRDGVPQPGQCVIDTVVRDVMGSIVGNASAGYVCGADPPRQLLNHDGTASAQHRDTLTAGELGGVRGCEAATAATGVVGSRESDQRAERVAEGTGAAAGEALGTVAATSSDASPPCGVRDAVPIAASSGPAPTSAPPTGTGNEQSGFGQRAGTYTGHDAGGTSSQLRTTVWTPWGHASATDAAAATPGLQAGAEGPRSNSVAAAAVQNMTAMQDVVAAGTVSSDGGEGDAGRGASESQTAPFTGLSFKLSAIPVVGRRVAAMRAQSGGLAVSAAKAGLEGPKRAQPSLSAVVAAPLVLPRRRSASVAVGPGVPAAASIAGTAAAPTSATADAVVVAARSPVEPSLRVQSAPQVPMIGAHGGSLGPSACSQVQAQQAWQPTGSNINGYAGVPEITAAVAGTVNHSAPHVQGSRDAPRSSAQSQAACASHFDHHDDVQRYPISHALPQLQHLGENQRLPSGTRGSPVTSEMRQEAQQQRHQQQEPVVPHLASAQSLSPPPLFRRRFDFILTKQGVAGVPAAPLLSAMPTDSYRSPLVMFRSYSGSSIR